MNYPSLNRLFTFVCFALSPIFGSALSFVWHGGALVCLFEIATGRKKFSADKHLIVLSVFMYLYVLINIYLLIENYRQADDIFSTMRVLTFALFPFSYSIWTISRKVDIARACVFASAIACYGAFILALYQHYALGIRAEGGAGNAIVFAQVVSMASVTVLAAALSIERDRALFLAGAFLAGVFAVIFSQARSGWIILLIDTVIVVFIYRKAFARLFSARVAFFAIGAAILIYLVSAPMISARLHHAWSDWKSLEIHQDYNTSLGMRLELWQIGLDLFRAHPFVGYGVFALRDLIEQGSQQRSGVTLGFSHFHDGLLTLLVQCGVIGAVSIVAMFATIGIVALRTLRRSVDEIERFGGAVLLILLASYIVTGSINILIGHDILDATLMIFLIVGSYLAAGTSMAPAAQPKLGAGPVNTA